jgi:hypothetical protein
METVSATPFDYEHEHRCAEHEHEHRCARAGKLRGVKPCFGFQGGLRP